MKKLFLVLCLTLFLVSSASATCTVTLDKESYAPTETAIAEISCAPQERNKEYTLNWTYQNGTSVELDNGTTPNGVGQTFYELYTIPSNWPIGIFLNATISGLEITSSTDSANISSAISSSLLITGESFGGGYLGLVSSITAIVKDESGKKISGGFCKISGWSNDETRMLMSKDTVMIDGEIKVAEILSTTRFEEGIDYAYKILCYCGSDGSGTECIDEEGASVNDSIGSSKNFFTTLTWLTVNTVTDRNDYIMKNELVVCANVTNIDRSERIPIQIYTQVRCSSGTDNDEDLDRTLIVDDDDQPDNRGISTNTTQMQCKRFQIPESKYLQGRSSECYASTDVWVLNNLHEEVIGYSTTSPVFNITSTELNINPDWQRTSEYNWNTIINLSTDSFVDFNGIGIGDIDLKLNMIETSIKSSDQYGTKSVSLNDFIMTQYIKNITAKNSTGGDIAYNFEVLDDGSIEIELTNVDISPTGWANVSLEFNQFYERQAVALEGIENKTGTFHLDIDCPSAGQIGSNLACIVNAYVEDSQTVQKEVDFTCHILDGVSTYSSVNFNQMVTKTPIALTQTFAVPSTFTSGRQYVLQCYADYYNLGSRRDSFYDTFTAAVIITEGGSFRPLEDEAGRVPITGGIIGIGEPRLGGIYLFFAIILILIAAIIFIASKIKHKDKIHPIRPRYYKSKLLKKIAGISIFILILLFVALGIYTIGGNLITAYQASQESIIQDPLFRTIILSTFIIASIIILFKALDIRAEIKIGHMSPVEKYWKKRYKD